MISGERMIRNLKDGVAGLRANLAYLDSVSSPAYERCRAVRNLTESITWCYEDRGTIVAAEDATVTEILVAIIQGPTPDGINPEHTFQMLPGELSAVYVRRREITPTWAGTALLHELSHFLEHLDGSYPTNSSRADWWKSEALAYQVEALAIDANSGRRFLTVVDALAAQTSIRQLLNQDPDELSARLYQQAFPASSRRPPAGPNERGLRSAGLNLSAVVACALYPRRLTEVLADTAGPEVLNAAEAWRYI